jgi:hypothetical protein
MALRVSFALRTKLALRAVIRLAGVSCPSDDISASRVIYCSSSLTLKLKT